MLYKASAPGSLMLLGEYAVLHGKHALVCAVDKRITVTLTPRVDDQIQIHSALGQYAARLSELTVEKPFQFVLGALKHYQPRLRRGCDIKIEAGFSDKIGLGSSAAVTIATLATLITWLDIRISPLEMVRQGRNIVRQIQGIGSGADIAASVYGGMVSYQAHPLAAEKIAMTHPLTLLYSGFKTPTAEAIQRVQQYFSAHPQLFRHISNSIGQCALEGIQLVRKEDWKSLGHIMNIQQGMMEAIGVNLPILNDLILDLRQQKNIWGAKISGSGLGDCVIGLGEMSDTYTYSGSHSGVQAIPVTMTLQGVQCEKI